MEVEPKFLPDLIKNFEQLYETKDDCDLIIYAGEGPNVQKIYAHSVILRCQSTYFYTAFSNNWAEKKDGMYIFNKPNVTPNIMNKLLKFFYCGKLDLDFENAIDVIKLLIAVDEFGLSTLAEHIQEFFVNNQLKVDPVGILKIIFENENFSTLQNLSLEKICQEPHILFNKYSFLTIPAHIFESLLSRDDLMLKEIEIWNNLIKWAHAQNPTVNRDPSAWTKDEIKIMEQTMHNFIPLIRFQDITSEEYCSKVMCYKKLLPKKLKREILQFYLMPSVRRIAGSLPPRLPKINSVIINTEHVKLIASWLDRKDEPYKKTQEVQYEFDLILRGSVDGLSPPAFHVKCDSKEATILIAKIKGTNKLVGGYNPLNWSGNGIFKNTSDSFIFCLDDYQNINTARLGRVINTQYAISCWIGWGPLFGFWCGVSHDLMMHPNGTWSSRPNSYPNINIPRNFEVDDYEVFKVVKVID
ncbi:hypothetical protein RclHR1_10170008 [Rhizophagus clarus]|uniref:BTB/POZ domain-containing protein n=1 Tax=Rhizophagus clarus TaxID=94130 RepID=A0A2Z6QSX6_9GLOM|nr:hypothetical protein RclHR1_10170008 [Rhizophagus clarus]GES85083.1 BTB/POZ domain-containing protein [Rhizophagus clarus]